MGISRSKYPMTHAASSVMRQIWKYTRDVVQCARSSYCIDYLFIILQKKIHFKYNFAETFAVSCGMLSNVIISNVISLFLRNSDMDSENVSLILHSVSDGQKTFSSKGVSLIGI